MRRHNMSEKRTVETGNAGGGWSRESKRGSHLHIADRGRVEAAHKSVEISLPPGVLQANLQLLLKGNEGGGNGFGDGGSDHVLQLSGGAGGGTLAALEGLLHGLRALSAEHIEEEQDRTARRPPVAGTGICGSTRRNNRKIRNCCWTGRR